jgi:2-keto-3-deoxy-L-rhamnonate aldolase RhmA
MKQNPIRKALIEKKITIGSWVQIANATSVEILANTGYDWIAFDCEHTDIDISELSNLMRGLFGRGSVPLVRVRENDTLAIRQVLDIGARGVIVPMINNSDDAREAVAAAKYAPMGVRGFGFTRANNYGQDFDSYVATANEDICVLAMVETKTGVENIEEILAVDGIDGVFVGPYDLSGSFGIPGQLEHKLIEEAKNHVVRTCEKAGKSAGLHIVNVNSEKIVKAIEDGFTFIALGADAVFLQEAANNALSIARKV